MLGISVVGVRVWWDVGVVFLGEEIRDVVFGEVLGCGVVVRVGFGGVSFVLFPVERGVVWFVVDVGLVIVVFLCFRGLVVRTWFEEDVGLTLLG